MMQPPVYRPPRRSLGAGQILAIVVTTMIVLCIVGCLSMPVWGHLLAPFT